MLFGSRERFAVECEIAEAVNGWVLGTFCLWINGQVVGDQNDNSVDLNGCLNWLRDLVSKPRNRHEPGLYEMSKDQVFLRLASSVLASDDPHDFVKERYQDTFSRFHISHIGMSSFDRVTILFLKNEHGMERLVWKTGNKEIADAYLSAGEIEHVFSESIPVIDASISSVGCEN